LRGCCDERAIYTGTAGESYRLPGTPCRRDQRLAHSLAVGATSNEEELRQRIETVGRELYAVRIALLRTGILTLADLQAAEKELAAGIDIERPEGDASI
jgi:hypothetical protein